MKKKQPVGRVGNQQRIAQAEARTAQAETRTAEAETRTEQAKTRTESAETRTEEAESRTEHAKTRTEHAENRTEQADTRTELAESALRQELQKEAALRPAIPSRLLKPLPVAGIADQSNSLRQLTGRQREVLQLIAEGQTTKQIGDLLKLSPKTVEYHRLKLMAHLNLHDIPALVRFAMRVGMLPQEN